MILSDSHNKPINLSISQVKKLRQSAWKLSKATQLLNSRAEIQTQAFDSEPREG